MKRFRILMLLSIVSLVVETSQAQQLIVRVPERRPGMVVFKRPHRPSPQHVWVDEEWTPAGTRYAYHKGYWVVPAHPGAVWVPGHWDRQGRGYFWVPGHWR